MVGTRLPAELIDDLEKIESVEHMDRSATVRKLLYKAVKDWKLDYSAAQYSEGRMTVTKAAEAADVSVWEMLGHLRQKKIAAQYDLDDLKQDVAALQDLPLN